MPAVTQKAFRDIGLSGFDHALKLTRSSVEPTVQDISMLNEKHRNSVVTVFYITPNSSKPEKRNVNLIEFSPTGLTTLDTFIPFLSREGAVVAVANGEHNIYQDLRFFGLWGGEAQKALEDAVRKEAMLDRLRLLGVSEQRARSALEESAAPENPLAVHGASLLSSVHPNAAQFANLLFLRH